MHYSLAANNNNWEVALRNQIEETARRNSGHKKYAQVEDRTKGRLDMLIFWEMDDIVIKLRELANTKPMEAAKLQIQAMSILDETDRLITAAMPDTVHITSYFKHNLNILKNRRESWQSRNKVIPEKSVFGTTTMRFATFADEEGVYDEDKQPTMSISTDVSDVSSGNRLGLFCFCRDTETKNKRDDNVRDLWKTQVI
ncbi:unnamed protein product [Onchocerca flexuosa]|uniref:Reverse transcriptase domain-containing protein n=1 Tax=Onchocerca flexuosa TaxID=387005 RepID=A0A183I346_9BILA|nr:unnamed protein product [Onchocerca flexuosa]